MDSLVENVQVNTILDLRISLLKLRLPFEEWENA